MNRHESARVMLTNLTATNIQQISVIIGKAWEESMLAAYGSGLLNYHVFCDLKSIPEEERAPVNLTLISAFIASIAGAYSGSTIDNYVYGIRAWHILHGVRWQMETAELEAILWAAEKVTPHTSKRRRGSPIPLTSSSQYGANWSSTNCRTSQCMAASQPPSMQQDTWVSSRCQTLVPSTKTGTSNHLTLELSTTTMAFTQWFSTYPRPRPLIRAKTSPGQNNRETQIPKLPSRTTWRSTTLPGTDTYCVPPQGWKTPPSHKA
jgi:hypothetical protein